jgi:hypothetical protein
LAVVPVALTNPKNGSTITAYGILDNCSDTDVISQEAVRILGLPVKRSDHPTTIHTVTGSAKVPVATTNIEVSSVQNRKIKKILPDVTILPCRHFEDSRVPYEEDLRCFNDAQEFLVAEKVDVPHVLILISMRHADLHRPTGVIMHPEDPNMYITTTKLGMVVHGGGQQSTGKSINFIQTKSLDAKLDDWLNFDTKNLYDRSCLPSFNERKAEAIMEKGIRFVDGRVEVPIPWKRDPPIMPDSLPTVRACLEKRRKRFKKDENYFRAYAQAIDQYEAKGYSERIPESEIEVEPGRCMYLDHHAVAHPRKVDRRIVFNPSMEIKPHARVPGVSLNSQIMDCPNMLEQVFGVLVRFREQPVAVVGDIQAFFHALRTTKQDQDYHRYLWLSDSKDVNSEVVHFRMLRHLFGGAASQAAALKGRNWAFDHGASSVGWTPEDVRKIIRSFYSDDNMRSFQSAEMAIGITREVIKVLADHGFILTKFVSNDKKVTESLSVDHQAEIVDLVHQPEKEETCLGLRWRPNNDRLYFSEPKEGLPYKTPTKRMVLSRLMSTWDPLGLLSPFVLPMKILLQDLVAKKLEWDEELTKEQNENFLICVVNLQKVSSEISVARCYVSKSLKKVTDRSLHLFADGSTAAYGAAGYLRSEDVEGQVECALTFAKSKVAPTKGKLTVPRLELNAAVAASRISSFLHEEMELPIHSVTFWADSQTTLRYVRNKDKRYSVYVSNRVHEVQTCTSIDSWRYVPTDMNPGDLASRPVLLRGDPLTDPRVQLWFHGPKFLLQPSSEWPGDPLSSVKCPDSDLEVIKEKNIFATVKKDYSDLLELMLHKSNNLFKAKIRVAALVKFVQYFRDGKKAPTPISVRDLKSAESKIMFFVQKRCFSAEFESLSKGESIPKSSSIWRLRPFLDPESGLLRVGSRLQEADVPYEYKFPIILPKKGHITHLLIHEAHISVGHMGTNSVLSYLRSKYWVINGRTTVNNVIHKCLKCQRYNARLQTQVMAPLPANRIAMCQPVFNETSLDVFGWFYVKRGRTREKRYVTLFTCTSTRAVHMEPLFSLDLDSMIECIRRFICRRGQIQVLQSDNATNMHGSNRELTEAIENWNRSGISDRLLQRGIEWKFLPSRASHMAGVHEVMIRCARSSLRHTLDDQVLGDESFMTLLAEVEYVLNSRPLTAFSNHPDDLRPLCPNDILLPRPGAGLPPDDLPDKVSLKRRWRQTQQLVNRFWKKFHSTYLSKLTLRPKWNVQRPNVAVNDLVVISEPALPRSQWTLGRVKQVYTGRDALVRSCLVKTATTELVRPIVKLAVLEKAED